MRFWVNHLSRSIFEKSMIPIMACNDHKILMNIQKIDNGYALFNAIGTEASKILIIYKVREVFLQIYIQDKKWIVLERPQAILWHVYVRPEPEIVTIERKFLRKTYCANFSDGWNMQAKWMALLRKYQITISREDKIIEGLSFAMAMDLAMQTYTIELS